MLAMFADYYQMREWLEEFIPYTYSKKNLGLARISYLLKLLENPQKKFKSIHVAGTSGKGSTAFYIAKLLQQETRNKKQETKVGLHVSPHLVDIRERMQIMINDPVSESANETGSLMPMDRFLRLFDEIYSVVKKIKEEIPDLDRMQIMINDPVSESANETGSLMPMDRFLRLFDEIYSVVKKIKEEIPD